MPTASPAPRRPNVVFFFTDQQRWDASALHGNPLDLMPNFDRLARQNTHLANLFTCQPVCGPARACLQTGRYATANGVVRNGLGLKDDAVTLADCFNHAGYRTGYIGKWHLAPGSCGIGAVPVKHRAGYRDWLAANALEMTSDAYHTRLWDAEDNPVDLPGYRADALTDAAIRYVNDRHHHRGDETDPYFLFISYLEPHHQNHLDDYPAPTGYRERYAGRWTPPDLAALLGEHGNGKGKVGGTAQQHLGGYWGMIKRLDECLGRLVDALDSLGELDHTLIVFTSDHGCHFKTRNREYKRSCHDSSIHVPGLIAGPGFVGGGRVERPVSLVDLPATLLDACGIAVPGTMQGRSIVPLVSDPGGNPRGAAAAFPDDVFVQISESHTGRAVRTGRWKYAVSADPEPGAGVGSAERYAETELYDLACDPYELTNLITSHAHTPVRAVMRERLLRRMEQAGEARPQVIEAQPDPPTQRRVDEAEVHQ